MNIRKSNTDYTEDGQEMLGELNDCTNVERHQALLGRTKCFLWLFVSEKVEFSNTYPIVVKKCL